MRRQNPSEKRDNLEIHQLTNLHEYSTVIDLQRAIWGFQEVELIPARFLVVASKIGGQVLGAFHGAQMVAFCFCIPGLKPGGTSYLHSHMLGVLPEYRNTGLGRRLKLKQREYALHAGVDLIEWTFDPLEIKNAFLNIERLGAIGRRYVHNQYGMTSSRLHGGLPTDRIIAEWWIRSTRVGEICAGRTGPRTATEATVVVPAEIDQIRNSDPKAARALQSDIGAQFQDYFRHGLAIIGFEKTESAGTYLLGKWESK